MSRRSILQALLSQEHMDSASDLPYSGTGEIKMTISHEPIAKDYFFLSFLTLLNVMNFVDRQLLASFANWIVDLGLTTAIWVANWADLYLLLLGCRSFYGRVG